MPRERGDVRLRRERPVALRVELRDLAGAQRVAAGRREGGGHGRGVMARSEADATHAARGCLRANEAPPTGI